MTNSPYSPPRKTDVKVEDLVSKYGHPLALTRGVIPDEIFVVGESNDRISRGLVYRSTAIDPQGRFRFCNICSADYSLYLGDTPEEAT